MKSWWKSKTLWGIIIALVANNLTKYGFEFSDADRQQLLQMVMDLIALGGTGLAIFGRAKAKDKLVK